MIGSNIILFAIYILGAFTLYYTYQNDFNVFLLTLLLVFGALWCYLYITEFIGGWDEKINGIKQNIESKIDFMSQKMINSEQVKKFLPQ